MVATGALSICFFGAAALAQGSGGTVVWSPGVDGVTMLTVPGVVLLVWQIRKSLADSRHVRVGLAR